MVNDEKALKRARDTYKAVVNAGLLGFSDLLPWLLREMTDESHDHLLVWLDAHQERRTWEQGKDGGIKIPEPLMVLEPGQALFGGLIRNDTSLKLPMIIVMDFRNHLKVAK